MTRVYRCVFNDEATSCSPVGARHAMANGIALRGNMIYVVDVLRFAVTVYERRRDGSLVVNDTISLPHAADNVYALPDGSLLLGSMPRLHQCLDPLAQRPPVAGALTLARLGRRLRTTTAPSACEVMVIRAGLLGTCHTDGGQVSGGALVGNRRRRVAVGRGRSSANCRAGWCNRELHNGTASAARGNHRRFRRRKVDRATASRASVRETPPLLRAPATSRRDSTPTTSDL